MTITAPARRRTSSSAANERNTFLCLIETAEGVDNAEAIASIDGVDCLWVGHFDLSVSLGIPGEFANPKFIKAIDKIVAAAKKHNKSLGRAGAAVSSRASGSTSRASISSAIRAMSGCSRRR